MREAECIRAAIILIAHMYAMAQNSEGAKERIKVYSHAIEGNLPDDPAERDVTAYPLIASLDRTGATPCSTCCTALPTPIFELVYHWPVHRVYYLSTPLKR